jgi:hypothetical protein
MAVKDWINAAVEWLRQIWREVTSWIRGLGRFLDRVLDWLVDNLDVLLALRDFTVQVVDGIVRVVDARQVDQAIRSAGVTAVSTDAEKARRYDQALRATPAALQTSVPLTWRESRKMRGEYPGGLAIDVHNPLA